MKFFTIQPPHQLTGVVNHFWVSMCNHSEKEQEQFRDELPAANELEKLVTP